MQPYSDGTQAYGPLVKLVSVPAAIGPEADVAVLSVCLGDLLARRDPEVFEREAAALSDLLAGARNCPVLWVTPPPFPSMPGRTRPYAAAVKRVAAARLIPVADLFTAFKSRGAGMQDLFLGDNPALSGRGHELAARVIARALLLREGGE
jgi:hypothetical protein